jgi:hypothetical protein
MFLGNEHTFAGIDFTNGRAALAQISSFRYHVEHGEVTPLIWLLQNNGFRDCSDPLDRIYAMLGMRNEDGPGIHIQASYEKSVKDVYTEIARKTIQSQGSLRICADASERVQGDGIVGLPSWVPDWTRKPTAHTFELLNASHFYFNSSGGRVHVDDMQDRNILIAEGRVVDSVTDIIDTQIPDAATETERRQVLIDNVLPLLYNTLQSQLPASHAFELAHKIVNTITVGGYTRKNSLGDSGLPPLAWSKWICHYMVLRHLNEAWTFMVSVLPIDPEQWLHALTRQALQFANRRFAMLKYNVLSLVPKMTSVGDSIVILHGSSLPFVLRPADDGRFKMVGTCFVDGIMHGERVTWVSGDQFPIC